MSEFRVVEANGWDEGYAAGVRATRRFLTTMSEVEGSANPYVLPVNRMGASADVAWREGFAAGRAAASPDERLREADRAALVESIAQTERFRGGPCLCSDCVEKRADAEATVDAVLAALAAADRDKPDECRAPHCWSEYGTPCGTCPVEKSETPFFTEQQERALDRCEAFDAANPDPETDT